LLLTMLAAACGAWLLGAIIPRLDVAGLDTLLMWDAFAIAFTIVTVGGVANAINIIDGYNGLASGYAVIVLAAFAVVSARVATRFFSPRHWRWQAPAGFSVLELSEGKFSGRRWGLPARFLAGGTFRAAGGTAPGSLAVVSAASARLPDIRDALFHFTAKEFLRGRSPGQPESLLLTCSSTDG